jgi:2-polyprenyl-3-methyl-5-hydroxy-6-metoxy-1,4-benzoquinol methylase
MSINENQRVTRGFGLLENYLTKKRTRQANALIPDSFRQGRVLDIGCGRYPYFLLNTEFNEKYGIDQSSEITQSHTPSSPDQSIHLKKWDFGHKTGLPFDSDYFDVVTMLAVYEHIKNTQSRQLATEIHRVLKKGGLFIMTTPAGWAKPLLWLLARLRLVSPVEVYDHKETYSHKKIIRILEDSGFKKENITLGYFEIFMNIWGKIRK